MSGPDAPGRRSPEPRGAVAIVAKAPRDGLVKTRLLGALPPGDVVRLAECMLHDTVALARSLAGVHAAVVCPPGDASALSAIVPPDVQVIAQDGSGLAAALASAFRRLVGAGFSRVVALDADSPHLPPRVLREALARLDEVELVVGPTEDGGYHLVGASRDHPRLFDGAPLGSSSAFAALCERARALGLSIALVDRCYDVDVPEDLERLAADLRLDPSRAPRTAALLSSLRRRSDATSDGSARCAE